MATASFYERQVRMNKIVLWVGLRPVPEIIPISKEK